MTMRVLESFRAVLPGEAENPYLTQLETSLSRRCDVRRFSWGAVLTSRYDVLHVHWPEQLISAPTRIYRSVFRVLLLVLLVRLRLGRVLVVRTMHNLQPHETGWLLDRWLLALLDRRVRARIYLHEPSDPDPRTSNLVLPHGDYIDWYADRGQSEPRAGHLVCFGMVRPYKNIEGLIVAFRGVPDPEVSLTVAGRPASDGYGAELAQSARGEARITLQLRELDDDEVAVLVGSAQAVVIPYSELYNSGALLLALSLGRSVVAPRVASVEALADEIGEGWIAFFAPPLTTTGLQHALAELAHSAGLRGELPRFVDRQWAAQADRLVALFGSLRR